MAGLALFVLVTVHVATDNALSGYDPAVTARAVALRHPWLTPLVWLVTHLGGTVGLTALSLLVAAALAVAGRRFQAGVLLAAMAGSAASARATSPSPPPATTYRGRSSSAMASSTMKREASLSPS